jgi:hypothetical protein
LSFSVSSNTLQEKDDLEARFNEVNQKAEQAASLQLAAQQELERARQQASEALRSMDVERQQLRTVNNKYATLLMSLYNAHAIFPPLGLVDLSGIVIRNLTMLDGRSSIILIVLYLYL